MTDPFAEVARSHDARAAARTARKAAASRSTEWPDVFDLWRQHQTAHPLTPPTKEATT